MDQVKRHLDVPTLSPTYTERHRLYAATHMDPNLGRRTFTSYAFLVIAAPDHVVDAVFKGTRAQTKVQWASLGEAHEALYRAGPHLVCTEEQAEAYALGANGTMLPGGAPFTLAALNMLGFQDAAHTSQAPHAE